MREPMRPFDPDSFPPLAAIVALTAVVPAMLLVAPIVVGALITRWGFSPQQAGYVISLELGAMALAALPALVWMPKADWRTVVRGCLLFMALANVACAFVHSFAALALLRTLSGLAGGSVMVSCMAIVGMSRNQERNFGWYVTGQLVAGALGVELLPRVLPMVGLPGLYITLAVLLALLVFATGPLPHRGPSGESRAPGSSLGARAIGGLAAMFMFYIALAGVWAYVERLGAQAGITATVIGDDLMIATLFGIGGCLSATVLGGRLGLRTPLVIGYAILLGSVLALGLPLTQSLYALATVGFKYAWTFALPYLLVCISQHDRSGRLIVLTNLMMGTGLAVGPTVTALMLGVPADYRHAIPIGAFGCVVSFLLIQPLAGRRARAADQPAVAGA